ncbi:NAD(P)H-dependent oxidoreductase [Geodermatophilus normandii]|uniref:NAD(P)H-dependent oxidoreductase n=1 Tax=Geodermatophilus normandii TaxID=1137989 RepID=UPI00195352C6
MSRPVLQVVAASTRPGRRGLADARWVQRLAEEHAGFDVELVDLAEVGLADAFVLVTPEYDHSSPASLENALDHLSAE